MLKACLLDRQAALATWRTWRSLIAPEHIDYSTERLLPYLFHRLGADLDTSDHALLANVTQRHGIRHHEQMQCLQHVLATLANAGIETLLLKGAALNLSTYPAGTRPMADMDVVVPRHCVRQAFQALSRDGWSPSMAQPERLVDAVHGCQFQLAQRERLDLHWDFFHGHRLADADQQIFWGASTLVDVAGAPARILSPTHQLLHTCVHGARWCATPPLRWLADACLIVRNSDGRMDWDELVALAERHEFGLYVWPTLAFLAEQFDVPIPAATIGCLRRTRTSLSGRLQHFLSVRNTPGVHPFWKYLPFHLVAYWRQQRQGPALRLGEYLQLQHQFQGPLHSHMPSLLRLQTAAAREALLLGARKIWRQLRGVGEEEIVCMGSVARWRTAGFHEAEHCCGHLFRWAKPEASVLFPDWPSLDCQVVVVLPEAEEWRHFAPRLSITFNGRPIPSHDMTVRGKELHFVIGRHLPGAGRQQRLSFHSPPLPLSNGDERRLGVPIRMIRITPQRQGERPDGSEQLPTPADVSGTARPCDSERSRRRVA